MPPMYNGEFSTATFVFEILTSIANIRSAFLSLKAKGCPYMEALTRIK
ncbi:hypothetical protein HanPSC8_Chr15g0667161 [Helianthus annuus]|nr:hypothetical protein HanPSC8_Chr15g0667161 [Helianthus annuus]